jgi:putative hydrolase of the HAD superfamily
MDRVVLWDFDGTLAERPGLWGACLLETLDEHEPGHAVELDRLRSRLRDGFPWHRPHVAHPELCEADAWWAHVSRLLAAAYEGVGIAAGRAGELASLARARYVDVSHGWRLFDDTLPVMEQLQAAGWRHAILSNHVPELPALVHGLGLARLVDVVHTSAATGYEKPHPRAFAGALDACGRPGEVWMVGDNPVADVAGAEAAGVPAILVRRDAPGVARSAPDLVAAARILAA